MRVCTFLALAGWASAVSAIVIMLTGNPTDSACCLAAASYVFFRAAGEYSPNEEVES